jgi:hypothetical protein
MRPYFCRDYLPERSRFQYKINSFAGIDASSEPAALSFNTACYGYNIAFCNGALINGPGINEAEVRLSDGTQRIVPGLDNFATGIKIPFLYRRYVASESRRDDRIVVLGTDKYLYQASVYSGSFARVPDIGKINDGFVSFCNYCLCGEDVLLILLRTGGMYVYNGASVQYYAGAPKLSAVCMHYERLFGADAENASRLWYSNDLDPTDWQIATNGAGYIDFMDEGGAILRVLSYKDAIYIFREHSIVRLTAYTDPSEYSLNKVYSTGSIIDAESIVCSEGRVFFMADRYLYAFDGYSASRVFANLTALLGDTTYVNVCCFKNKLYVAAMLKTQEDYAGGDEDTAGGVRYNNGFFCVDLLTGDTSVFRGTSVRGFFPLVAQNISELLVYFGNFRMARFGMLTESGNLFGKTLHKLWENAGSVMGSLDKLKSLRRIWISSRYAAETIAKVDGCEKSMSAYGHLRPQMLPICLVGDTVKLKFRTQNDIMYISGLIMEFDTIRRYHAT